MYFSGFQAPAWEHLIAEALLPASSQVALESNLKT
jgi:hypothetical protein